MSLAERVRTAEHTRQPGPTCAVSKALQGLDQEDADALLHLVYQRRDLTAPEVSDLLAEEDIDISPDMVRRHRLSRCRTCHRR